MSSDDLPFGFSPDSFGSGDDDLLGKIPLFAELRKLLTASGPVNWELARQTAIVLAGRDDPALPADAEAETADALRLADLWLDPQTTLPAGVRTVQAWTRVAWIEQTLPTWQALCDPVAARVAVAMGEQVASGLGGLLGDGTEGLGAGNAATPLGPMQQVLGSLGGLMFGAQVGQALGTLAGEVLTSAEVGLPLGPAGVGAMVPANIEEFGEGLSVPLAEVRLYTALREAAQHRLYGHVPWLHGHVIAAVEAYARGITVDADALQRAMSDLDPTDIDSLQQALGGGLFEQQVTPEQQQTLTRLETLLALVEGWVDVVVSAAAQTLPSASALAETLRRRRATGGPAEQTFATLVGLELRPRRLREAAALWRALTDARGIAGRDALWGHPDLLPSAADLDHPEDYVAGEDELLPPDDAASSA